MLHHRWIKDWDQSWKSKIYAMFGVMYVSVQSCCKSETVFVYHHTSSLLCGKILTTPTFLLLKYGFIADARLEAKTQKAVI